MHARTITALLLAVAWATGASAPVVSAQICGDADGSGVLTVTDGVNVLRAAAGLSSSCTASVCDADGIGGITVTDGVNVLRAAAGLPNVCLLPTLDQVDLSDAEIEAGITVALEGVQEPWGADFGLVLARVLTALGARAGTAQKAATTQASPEAADCVHSYCGDADYCGFPSNSQTAPISFACPAAYLPVSDCLNRACFQHDLDSFQDCVSGSRDPDCTPTGKPDCYFSSQSRAAGVDSPLFAKCDDSACALTTADRVVCAIARFIRDARTSLGDPPGCECPPCMEGQSCESSAGVCDRSTGGCEQGACVNIAGQWYASETVDITCTIDGQSESDSETGEGMISIRQEGCNISYVMPEFDVARNGTVTGNQVHISGPFAIALAGDVHFTKNTATVEGGVDGDTIMLSGEGIAEGTVSGHSFRCTGESTAVFSRSPAGSANLAEPRNVRKDSALLLRGSPQRFTIVGW